MLDKLKDMTGGDEARMKIYISAYLEEMPGYCDILKKAIEEKDQEQIKYVAHISKPLLSLMGFDKVYQMVGQLEDDIIKDSINSEVSSNAELLLTEMKKTIDLLRAGS